MWFKRKKKPDPDNALNETLRSLQNLLENENSTDRRTEPKISRSPEDQSALPSDFTFQEMLNEDGDSTQPVEKENLASSAVEDAADEEYYGDGEPLNPVAEERAIDQSDVTEVEDPAALDRSQTQATTSVMDFLLDSPVDEKAENNPPWTDPFENKDETKSPEDLIVELQNEDIRQDDIVIPAIDTIPVLNNVVYAPEESEADLEPRPSAVDLNQIIDTTVNDLHERLERRDLNAMNGEQEQSLRQVLKQILDNL